MKGLVAILLISAASPALAQHEGHGQHQGHTAPAPPAPPAPTPPPPPPPPDPHGGHAPAPAADPHAGHAAAPVAPAPPVAPPPAEALSGPAHAADTVYDPRAMESARRGMREEHGGMEVAKIMIDQLEWKPREGGDGFAWDAQAWHGGDVDKLWLKSEGEGETGSGIERAEVQALWSRAIDPWFDLQLGLRHDFRPDPDRTYLVAGIQGLAPYWFELDGALFVSEKGDVSARIEGEYDLRITQRLILQPMVEVDLALQDVPEIGIGSGLSSAEAGLRLRYEIEPQFAPYVGIEYERAFGRTADYGRARGEEAGSLSLLVGLRAWF